MAYSPISFIASNYRDYKNNWLKAYEPGTTTPKVMATDSTLSTLISKAELNIDGFIVSAGQALIIPYIDGAYDLWLFPTEPEADANDTSNALRVADNITGVNGVGVSQGNVKSFDTVQDAVDEVSVLKIFDGAALNIKEHTQGFGGGGMWDVVLAASVTTNTFNVVQCTGITSLALVLRIESVLDVSQVGARKNDLTFDSQPAIQFAIEYCAPFPWLGSVALTRDNGRSIAKLTSRGTFRVDSPVLINPFLDWDAGGVGGFFYSRPSTNGDGISVGTVLYPFFTNKEQWVVDTNPWNSSGVRAVPAKELVTNQDFDSLVYTMMHGIKIQGLAIIDDIGSGILGGLRLLGAIESETDGVLCERFMYPYMEMCCWAHTRGRIHTTGYHAGFTSINGTIGTDRGGCYFTGSASYPPEALTVGDWWVGLLDVPPLNPADKVYLRTGLYLRGADTFPSHTMLSPVTEGWERPYMCVGCSIKVIKPYIEANTEIVCHGWNSTAEFEQPFLFNPDGGGVGLDDMPFFYVSNGFWKVTNPLGGAIGRAVEYTNNFAQIHIEDAPSNWIKDYPFSTFRDGADFEFRPAINFNKLWSVGSFDVFVANGGGNNNYGLSTEYPLANGERMLTRLVSGSSVNLIYADDQSHGVNGTDTSNKDLKVNITRTGEGTIRPIIFKSLNFGQVYGAFGLDNSAIDIEDVDIQVASTGAIDPTYAGMFRLTGTCAINIFNVGIEIQSGKSLINPYFNKSSIVTMNIDGSTIDGHDDGGGGGVTYGALSINNFSNAGKLTVIDDAQSTTLDALIGDYGTDTTKLSSRLKP